MDLLEPFFSKTRWRCTFKRVHSYPG
jgi:hypothetical protein